MKIHNQPLYERQVVYFLDDIEVDNLPHYEEGRKLLLSKEIQIIPLSETEEFLDHFEIIDGKYPTNQTMLILSPNNPTKYAEVEDSTIHFALNKLTLILRLSQLLGAKQVTIEDIYSEKDESNLSTKTEASYGPGNGSIETNKLNESELDKYIGYVANFEGGSSDYNKAKLFIRKNHLGGDVFISNLVEMFDPEFPSNKLNNIKQKIKLTSKTSNTFNLLAGLKIPVGGGNFELNKKNISQKNYILEISIEF